MLNNELTCEKGSCSNQIRAVVISGTPRRPDISGDRSEAGRNPATGPAPVQTQASAAANATGLPRERRKRVKWTKDTRKELWVCYILGRGPERGFRKKMMWIWRERRNNASFTEPKLASQINEIIKKGLLSQQEKDEALAIANNTEIVDEDPVHIDNQEISPDPERRIGALLLEDIGPEERQETIAEGAVRSVNQIFERALRKI